MKRITKLLTCFVLFIFFGLSHSSLFAHEPRSLQRYERNYYYVTGITRLSFANHNCVQTNSCSLKNVWFLAEDYRIELPDGHFNYGTRLFAQYETHALEQLEDYVFVQFIEGCVFVSYRDPATGEIKQVLWVRDYLGQKNVPFYHVRMEIDSTDLDPAYATSPGRPRHYHYQWVTRPGAMPLKTEHIYGLALPPRHAELFISDLLNQAFVTEHNGPAHNVSLRYKTCMYKAADVPLHADDPRLSAAVPLVCFNWKSSYVWDHEDVRFEQPNGISPQCQKAKVVRPDIAL